jgi:hypothetical protein
MDAAELQNLSGHAAIALATAAIERTADRAAELPPEVASTMRAVAEALWKWQQAPKARGQTQVTVEQAQRMPSRLLYSRFSNRLLELADQHSSTPKALAAVGATIAGLGFALSFMDRQERALNPGKPQVLGSDVTEADWDTLAASLKAAVQAAADPAEMSRWLSDARKRSIVDFPRPADPHDYGPPVPRSYFFKD